MLANAFAAWRFSKRSESLLYGANDVLSAKRLFGNSLAMRGESMSTGISGNIALALLMCLWVSVKDTVLKILLPNAKY